MTSFQELTLNLEVAAIINMMNSSKLYVPDPQKWVKFYRHMADGKVRLQPASQLGNGKVAHSFIAPIDHYVKQFEDSASEQPPIKLVTPAEQVVEQAKSELKRKDKGIKRPAKTLNSQNKNRRGKRKVSKPKTVKKKRSKKGKLKTKVKKTLGKITKIPKKHQIGGKNQIGGRKKKSQVQKKKS